MGSFFSKLFRHKKPCKIIIFGLDAAGKTTLLYNFIDKMNYIKEGVPTIGFNIENIKIKNLTLTTMDLGYQQKTKSLWKHYTKDIEGIIFIVDSSDTQRIQECISTFHENVLSDDNCKDVPVIIFANKQDIKKMEKQQIIEHLKLEQFQRNEQGTYSFDNKEINKKYSIFNWHVQECQANKNLGIMPGFEWLSQQINLRRKFMKKKENQKNKTV